MGRWRDAWQVLRGRRSFSSDAPTGPGALDLSELDERYLMREELNSLVNQMAELELAMASHFDKLNTLAARLRKRDQREKGTETPSEGPVGDPGASGTLSRAELKRQLAGRLHGRTG